MLTVKNDGYVRFIREKVRRKQSFVFLFFCSKIFFEVWHMYREVHKPQAEVFKGNFEVFNLITNLKGFKRTYKNKGNTFSVRCSFRGPWSLSLILCLGFQMSKSHTAPHTTKMTALRPSLQFKSLTQNLVLLLGLDSQQIGMFRGHVQEISSVNFLKSTFLEVKSSRLDCFFE